MVKRPFFIVLAAICLSGCQHASEGPIPAVLANDSSANVDALKSALAGAMGHARVELGAGDPTQESRISVLPPALSPQDDRSPVLPTYFDLVMRDDMCIAIHSETGSETELTDVTCKAKA